MSHSSSKVINEGSEVNIMTWASLSGHVLLPFPLTQVMSNLLKAPLHACEAEIDMGQFWGVAATRVRINASC